MKSAMHPIAEVDAAIALAAAMVAERGGGRCCAATENAASATTARVDVGKCPKMRARSTIGPKVQ